MSDGGFRFPRRTDPVREWARRGHPRTALVDRPTGRRWSYPDLDALADRRAETLRRWGVGPGDRVATLMGNAPEHVALFLACGRVGAALVPLNWRLAPGELAAVLADARPARLVTGAPYRGLRDDALARLDERSRPPVSEADALEAGAGAPGDDPPVRASHGGGTAGWLPGPDDPAMVLYTSGSTGRPKGAVLSHRQLAANAAATAEGWELGPDDVAPVTTPLFHTGGWNVFATPLWSVGGTVVLFEGFDPDDFLRALDEEGCTVALAVPTQLHVLAQSPTWGRPLPSLRWLISGGAPCPASLSRAVREAGYAFKEGYGLTECGPNCFAWTTGESEARPGWTGRPVPYLSMRLLDEAGGVVEGAGEGELALSGPQVFSGYLHDPERTAEVFTPDGWLRTGDVAERAADGAYRICGRLKEMFISGGENVYPGEVEAALSEHPRIAEVAVVAVTDEKWGEVGCAFVVSSPGAAPSPQDIRRFARARLAAYKVPKSVELVPELPRLGSGKVDRAALAGAARGAAPHAGPGSAA